MNFRPGRRNLCPSTGFDRPMTNRDNHEIDKIDGVDAPTESGDPVWRLLLRARKPEISPFFTRNVLREIRQFEEKKSGAWSGLRSLFTVPRIAFAGAAAILVAFLLVSRSGDSGSRMARTTTEAPPVPELARDVDPVTQPVPVNSSHFDIGDYQEEVQMIDYLDGLLAVQDVEILDDEALAELLF